MPALTSIDAILAFAIGEEEKASKLYAQLAADAKQPHLRRIFEGFSAEEARHKELLEGLRESGGLRPAADEIPNLGIAENMREIEMSPDMDYQQTLVFAMQREKAAFRMYTALAEVATDEKARKTLQALAQEEAKHKLSIETEYDESILTEG